MDKSDATGIGGIIVGAGLAVSALTVPWDIPDGVKHALFWLGLLGATAGSQWLLQVHLLQKIKRNRQITLQATILLMFFVVLLLSEINLKYLTRHRPLNFPERALTFKELFTYDFPKESSLSTTMSFQNADNGTLFQIPIRIVIDIRSRSIYLTALLTKENNEILGAVTVMARAEEIVNYYRNTSINTKLPGDMASIRSDNFLFTKTVILYTENDLSLQELSFIETRANNYGVFVQIRGSDYYKIWEKTIRLQLPPFPFPPRQSELR